jgi:hypothetical protein
MLSPNALVLAMCFLASAPSANEGGSLPASPADLVSALIVHMPTLHACAAAKADNVNYLLFPIGGHRMTVKTERAILAGGPFQGLEDLLRKRVVSTRVGYTDRELPNPTSD